MGKFADRLRKIFNPKLAAQVEFNRAHGLNDNARLARAKDIGHDAYFIRVSDKPNLFLHWNKETSDQLEYIIKEGTVGACIWKLENGQKFIDAGGQQEGLELVRIDQVLNLKS